MNCKTQRKQLPSIPHNALVPVSLKILQKGSCSRFAIICLPKVEDLTVVPIEPFHKDPNEIKRKQLRQEHKDLLKQLKRKRKKAKKKGEVITAFLFKNNHDIIPNSSTINTKVF